MSSSRCSGPWGPSRRWHRKSANCGSPISWAQTPTASLALPPAIINHTGRVQSAVQTQVMAVQIRLREVDQVAIPTTPFLGFPCRVFLAMPRLERPIVKVVTMIRILAH